MSKNKGRRRGICFSAKVVHADEERQKRKPIHVHRLHHKVESKQMLMICMQDLLRSFYAYRPCRVAWLTTGPATTRAGSNRS